MLYVVSSIKLDCRNEFQDFWKECISVQKALKSCNPIFSWGKQICCVSHFRECRQFPRIIFFVLQYSGDLLFWVGVKFLTAEHQQQWCSVHAHKWQGKHPAHGSCYLSHQTSLTLSHATFCAGCFCLLVTKIDCSLPVHCSTWPAWSEAGICVSVQKERNSIWPARRQSELSVYEYNDF